MPLLLGIGFAFAFIVAVLTATSTLGPLLKARRLHREPARPITTLGKGTDVTVRGAVLEPRRPPPYPRVTQGSVVFSQHELTVEEMGRARTAGCRNRRLSAGNGLGRPR